MMNRCSGVKLRSTYITAVGVDLKALVMAKQAILWILLSEVLVVFCIALDHQTRAP
jgi:hypothetical protein